MTDSNSPYSGQAPSGNLPELSVSEISQAIKRTLETTFDRVRVRGEISGFKRAASGHLYMALKDESAVMDAVCWKGVAGRLGIRPEDGMEVIATGRVTAYAGRSKYQIVIESLELAGEGALLKLLEDRRRKLAAEGLFDPERKQPLPFLPEVVGVVTSPTGAVIRDILHRLADRFPRRVLVWPVLVQGEGAAEQVAAAIDGFNRLPEEGKVPRPDVLIVARGGGSLEDLWAFNEEVVVRAAAASAIPLISAVGHETDTTLIDYAADRRAPTPTAAAEMAVPVRRDLLADLRDLDRRAIAGVNRRLGEHRTELEGLRRGLPDPQRLLADMVQRLDDRSERFRNAGRQLLDRLRADLEAVHGRLPRPQQQARHARGDLDSVAERLNRAGQRINPERRRDLDQLGVERRLPDLLRRAVADGRSRLDSLSGLLDSLSFEKVLERGYALVQGPEGELLTQGRQVKPGMKLTLQFGRDDFASAVGDGSDTPLRGDSKGKKKGPSQSGGSKKSDDPQGSLL